MESEANIQNSTEETKKDPNYFIVDASASYLNQIRKWTKFLSILGFIGVGFIVLIALFIMIMGSTLSSYMDMPMNLSFGMMGVFYLLLAGIYFIPIYYLYIFSNKMKRALMSSNLEKLTTAFRYLRNYYRFIGIFAIIFISLYIVTLIIMLITFGASGFYNL